MWHLKHKIVQENCLALKLGTIIVSYKSLFSFFVIWVFSVHKKMEFSIKDFFIKHLCGLVTVTEEILNRKLHFLCSVFPGHRQEWENHPPSSLLLPPTREDWDFYSKFFIWNILLVLLIATHVIARLLLDEICPTLGINNLVER